MTPPVDSPVASSFPLKPWWKRTRIGMRSLMIVIAALAIGMGWYSNKVRQQRRIVAELEGRGAKLFYDFQVNVDNGVVPGGDTPYPRRLVEFLGIDYFHSVTSIRIEDKTFDDDDLIRVFSVLDRIQTVGIAFSSVTDDGLKFLHNYKSMRGLFLDGSKKITDRGIDMLDLEHRPEVSVVCVRGTQVTQARAEKLRVAKQGEYDRFKTSSPPGNSRISPPQILNNGPAIRILRRSR